MMRSFGDEAVIRLYHGSEVFALARMDGAMLKCTAEGAMECFGMSASEVLKDNILNLMDSSLDQMEFHKLIDAGTNGSVDADFTCLLRTKGTKKFIWADRPSLIEGAGAAAINAAAQLTLPRQFTHSPELVAAPSTGTKRVKSDKTYHALDTADMSFNDVFEEPGSSCMSASLSSSSNIPTPTPSRTQSEHSLSDGPPAPDPDLPPEDGSSWGWYKTVSPSTSATFSNITSHIQLI